MLQQLTALEPDLQLPLYWNLPLSPQLEKRPRSVEDLLMEIRLRTGSRGDAVLPAGFRGAIHPLLTSGELQRELQWCTSNPWAPGFADLFGRQPEALAPLAPDVLRERAGGVYSRHGFRFLGIPAAAGGLPGAPVSRETLHLLRDSARLRFSAAADRATLFSYLLWPQALLPELTARLPRALEGQGEALFLMIRMEESAEPRGEGRLAELLEALAERFTLAFPPLAGLAAEAVQAEQPEEGPFPEVPDPLLRRRWQKAEPIRRRKSRSPADYRRLLDMFAPGSPDEPAGRTIRHRTEPVFAANMTGSISLAGPSFQANFVDGRLAGISRDGQPFLAGQPADSYLVLDGRPYPLEMVSAFSFDRQQDTGLRTLLRALLPEGREVLLTADAYFTEGQAGLNLELTARYPRLEGRLELLAPYEVALCELPAEEPAVLEAAFHGEPSALCPLPPEEGVMALYGCAFLLRQGGRTVRLDLRLGSAGATGYLQFRVERRGRRRLLLANLNGSYVPVEASLYSEVQESFSCRIGIGQAPQVR